MKGVVFTEFLDLVEDRFGLETSDRVITDSQLSTDGAYTAVGTYDYRELIQMVIQLSHQTGSPVSALVKVFGEHLFEVFRDSYPQVLAGFHSAFDFLPTVEHVIHVEVRKLYSDAELPDFEYEQVDSNHLTMIYHSSRPFADLAEGLIGACIRHFSEEVSLEREDLPPGDGTAARFTLSRR